MSNLNSLRLVTVPAVEPGAALYLSNAGNMTYIPGEVAAEYQSSQRDRLISGNSYGYFKGVQQTIVSRRPPRAMLDRPNWGCFLTVSDLVIMAQSIAAGGVDSAYGGTDLRTPS
jgi:hypothetical protein